MKFTFPFSYQSFACWRERTLQSKIALFGRALRRATARPILTGSFNGMQRSWNGCELGRQRNRQQGKDIDVDDDDSPSDWWDDEGDKLPFVLVEEFNDDGDEGSSIIVKTKSLG